MNRPALPQPSRPRRGWKRAWPGRLCRRLCFKPTICARGSADHLLAICPGSALAADRHCATPPLEPGVPVVGYRWLASHVRLGKAAQTEVNLVLNTIRARRQERRNHVASLKPKDAPAGMLSDRSRTTQLESGKQATTTVKKEQKLPGKQQEGSMTSMLLEAKRKRGDKGKIQ